MKKNNKKSILLSIINTYWFDIIISLSVMWLLVKLFEVKAGWSFVIFVLCLGIVRIIKSWKQIMQLVKYIESMMWGKPLDKDLWKKGEVPKWRYKKND